VEHPDNQPLSFRIDRWSSFSFRVIRPFLGDKSTVLSLERAWCKNRGDSQQSPTFEHFGFTSQANSLGVRERLGPTAELLDQNRFLFAEIADDRLLVPVHPARDDRYHEAKWKIHTLSHGRA
jgi:hypothetical protein